jgi:hypothetical protein
LAVAAIDESPNLVKRHLHPCSNTHFRKRRHKRLTVTDHDTEAPGPVLGMPENLRHNPIPWQQRRPQRIRRHSAMTDAPDGFVRTGRALDLKPKGASNIRRRIHSSDLSSLILSSIQTALGLGEFSVNAVNQSDSSLRRRSQRLWIETIARVRIVRGVPPAQRLIGLGPLCLGIGELALEIS